MGVAIEASVSVAKGPAILPPPRVLVDQYSLRAAVLTVSS